MSEVDYPLDKLVAVYLKIRNLLAEREEAHKTEIAHIKEQLDIVSSKLIDICNAQNADTIRTPRGTVSRRVQTRYWASDWESMYAFIREHNAIELLEKRISQGNMKQYLEDHPDDVPIGLQSDSKYVIQVRKPTSK